MYHLPEKVVLFCRVIKTYTGYSTDTLYEIIEYNHRTSSNPSLIVRYHHLNYSRQSFPTPSLKPSIITQSSDKVQSIIASTINRSTSYGANSYKLDNSWVRADRPDASNLSIATSADKWSNGSFNKLMYDIRYENVFPQYCFWRHCLDSSWD